MDSRYWMRAVLRSAWVYFFVVTVLAGMSSPGYASNGLIEFGIDDKEGAPGLAVPGPVDPGLAIPAPVEPSPVEPDPGAAPAPVSDDPIPNAAPAIDPVSDRVGATVAEFRVDEGGNASYSIPIQVTPGVAGMAPTLALSYNSRTPGGVMGPGWAIEGASQISRCRQARENGDFMDGTTPIDGNPSQVVFGTTDRLCLDGIRLLVTSGTYWAGTAVYSPENDPFTRVTTSGTSFVVQRKDGTTSSYGDTVVSPNSRPVTYVNLSPVAVSWNLSRVQDSVGNYINYLYASSPGAATHPFAAGAIETVLSRVEYTGHATTPVLSPYAAVIFEYDTLPVAQLRLGFQSGAAFVQSQRLARVKVEDATNSSTPGNATVRFYKLTYATSVSGSTATPLQSVKECRAADEAICFSPTVFTWSPAVYEFASGTAQTASSPDFTSLVGYKLADVDGDGRQDVVWARNGDSCGNNSRLYVSFLDRTATGQMTLVTPTQAVRCAARNLLNDDSSWHLVDYDGDGRADLFIAGANGGTWQAYLGLGRPASGGAVFGSGNLLAGLSPTIPVLSGTRHPGLFMDVNGDGVPDFLYPVTPSAATGNASINARLLQRQSGGVYAFSAPHAVDIDFLPGDPCRAFLTECSLNFFQAGPSIPSVDVNGDGRGDLTFIVMQTCTTSPCPEGTGEEPMLDFDADLGYVDPPERGRTIPDYRSAWYQFTADGTRPPASGSTVPRLRFTQYWTQKTKFSNGELPDDTLLFSLADMNGDGLMDIVYRDKTTATTYWVLLNTGVPSNPNAFPATVAYKPAVSVTGISNGKYLQLVDINGDGRTDFVYPSGAGASYYRRTMLDNGTFTAAAAVAGGGMLAGSALDPWVSLIGDLDGDGSSDFLRVNITSSSANLYTSRAGTGSRYQPRDVVTTITNGHGAITRIAYQPLTNKGIYQRGAESGAPARQLNYGWNSPVFDALAPLYVVNKVESSAPTRGSPNAMSTVRYRYEGAQVQAGGRGFLGFNVIWTFDDNLASTPHQYIVTRNSYAQNYPFIGMPLATYTLAVTGPLSMGSAELDACFANPETTAYTCFAPVGAARWPNLVDDGVLVVRNGNQPMCKGAGCATIDYNAQCNAYVSGASPAVGSTANLFTPPASAKPVFTHVFHDVTYQNDLATSSEGLLNGVTTTETRNGYCYEDNYGNLTRSRTVTWSGSRALIAQKLTTNTYTNNTTLWYLGRLTQSTVTFKRPGQSDITRSSNFAYNATTGLLASERVQKDVDAAQDLRTVYTHDDFGNRTGAYQCSADRTTDTACSTISTTFRQRPDDGTGHSGTRVQRYAKTGYDTTGRYTTESRLPFYAATGTTHLNEQAALTIGGRDEFGNATAQSSANGLVTTALSGRMGRPYYSADNLGHASTTTYRACSSVSCPNDAAFRTQTVTAGAPSGWTYFDVLGRPVLAITQSFDSNDANQKFSAVCSYADAHGRPAWQSEPFFAPATVEPDGSPKLTTTTPCNNAPAATTTAYDVLGRVIQVTHPDTGTVKKEYLGLVTFTTNPRGYTWQEARSPLGEVIETRDPEITGDASLGLIVQQTYDAAGNVLTIARSDGSGPVTTTITYDALGRKRTLSDPDAGFIQYAYNPAGDLITQTDAKNQTVRQDYDALGRQWRRTAPGADGNTITDTWTFDTAANGLGQAASEVRQSTTGVAFSRSTTFDSYGRLHQRSTSIAGAAYTETSAYDGYGRPMSQQDASGETLTSTYSTLGHLESLTDSRVGTLYQVQKMTARGQVAEDRRGNSNSLKSKLTYDSATGRLNTVCSGTTACTLQDLRYKFDLAGNLMERERSRSSSPTTETFTHDALNRLTKAALTKINGVNQLSPPATATLRYDKLGNVCAKNGVNYTYAGNAGCATSGSGGRPHAVTQVGSVGYAYDANGSQTTSTAGRVLAYNALNQLVSATAGGNQTAFQYAPGGDRFLRTDVTGTTWPAGCAPANDRIFCNGFEGGGSAGTSRTTHYVGNVEIIRVGGTVTEKRRYLGGVAIDLIRPGGSNETRYTFADHLGSIDVVASATGVLIEAMSFDVHGSRRNPTTWQGAGSVPTTTPRGYTGHEHLDAFGFIHMNGRTYDPATGRMLQADPLTDGTAQGLNRYSYVANNPLALTDPTGYSSWGNAIRLVAAIVITVYSGGTAAGAAWGYWGASVTAGQAFAAVVIGGFAAGAVQSGTLQGGLYGAFSAALFYGIGSAFTSAGSWATEGSHVFATNLNMAGYSAKVLAHGVAGGIMSSLQGGKFGNGFASAGVAQAFSGPIDRIDARNAGVSAGRAIAAAAVGGTTSVIAGGKFGNGAITGAFSRVFNDDLHERYQRAQEVARTKGDEMLGPYVSGYDTNNPNYHTYAIGPSELCTIGEGGCSFNMAAPIVSSEAVPFMFGYSGSGYYSLPYGLPSWLGGDPIQHSTPAPGVWSNVTMEDHRYYPGSVVHGLYESTGHLWLYTLGVGVGPNPAGNIYNGNWIFGSMHYRVQSRVTLQQLTGD